MKTIQKKLTVEQHNIILNEILQNSEGVKVRILICSGTSVFDSYARIQVYDDTQNCYKGVSYLYPSLMKTPVNLYQQCIDCHDNETIDSKIGHIFQKDITELLNEASMILRTKLD